MTEAVTDGSNKPGRPAGGRYSQNWYEQIKGGENMALGKAGDCRFPAPSRSIFETGEKQSQTLFSGVFQEALNRTNAPLMEADALSDDFARQDRQHPSGHAGCGKGQYCASIHAADKKQAAGCIQRDNEDADIERIMVRKRNIGHGCTNDEYCCRVVKLCRIS